MCFGDQDALDDRRKFFAPTPCGIGIPAAKTRKGCVGTFKVGPPFKRRAIAGQQRDIESGFDIGRAVACELEVAIPRHLRQRPVIKRMRIVQEAGRVLFSAQPATGYRQALDAGDLKTGFAQIGLED